MDQKGQQEATIKELPVFSADEVDHTFYGIQRYRYDGNVGTIAENIQYHHNGYIEVGPPEQSLNNNSSFEQLHCDEDNSSDDSYHQFKAKMNPAGGEMAKISEVEQKFARIRVSESSATIDDAPCGLRYHPELGSSREHSSDGHEKKKEKEKKRKVKKIKKMSKRKREKMEKKQLKKTERKLRKFHFD